MGVGDCPRKAAILGYVVESVANFLKGKLGLPDEELDQGFTIREFKIKKCVKFANCKL